MSTILKALRRLEEDKRTQAAMSLDEAVLDPARPAGNRRGIGVSVAAGVMAALGVIAIAWSLSGLLLPASEGAPAPLAPQRDMQVAKREAAEPPKVPERIEDVPRPPPSDPIPLKPSTAAARIEAFANPQKIRREMQRLAGGPIERVDEPESRVSPVPDPAVRVVQKAALPKPAPAPVVEKSMPKAPPIPARPPAVVAKAPAPAPVSEPVADPPVAVIQREPAPEIAVQEIIWHPNPARRVAIFEVDGAKSQRIGEGDQIAGFTVAEIGLSDVELVRNGVAVTRRIGKN